MSKINRLAGSLLMIFALSVSTSFASDVQCDKAEKQKYEEIICESVILNSRYDEIYWQQEELTNANRLPPEEYKWWRNKLQSCGDVECVDAVFGDWKAIDADIEKAETIQEQPSSAVVEKVVPPTPMEPIATVPASDTLQSEKDSENNGGSLVKWLVWIVAIGLMNFFMFSTQCPKCKTFFARTERGREKLVDDPALEEKEAEDEHHNSQGEKSDSSERKGKVQVTYTKYHVNYRCKKCGAKWNKVIQVKR